jgi:hypothetical protein
MITLAQEMGKLSLSLRSLQDTSTEEPTAEAPSFTRDYQVSHLLSGPSGNGSSGRSSEPPPSEPSTAAPPPAPTSITVIRGSAVADSSRDAGGRNGSGGSSRP